MLETVLTTLSTKDNNEGKVIKQHTKSALGESSGQGPSINDRKVNESAPMDRNEQWWDKLCRNSDDDSQKLETVAIDRLPKQLPSQEEVKHELLARLPEIRLSSLCFKHLFIATMNGLLSMFG